MRAVLLSTAVAAASLAAVPAFAVDITIGTTAAAACYRSAFANVPERFAVRVCDRALEEEALDKQDRAATMVNRGIIKMSTGDMRGADMDFDRALALNPDNAEALLNKGLLRLRLNKLEDAIGYFDRSLEARTLRPAMAFYARAISHEQLGNVRAAYADLLKARALDPAWDLPAQDLARFRVVSR